jgi:hypothetical protein
MAGATRSAGKRKRDLELPSSGCDGDIIVVLPRQAAAVQTTKKRGPLRESQTQANVTRRRTISRVEGMYNCPLLITRQSC